MREPEIILLRTFEDDSVSPARLGLLVAWALLIVIVLGGALVAVEIARVMGEAIDREAASAEIP